MRILVAEDDPVQAEAIWNVLTPLDHSVSVAGDGVSAIHRLRSEMVDVVILDWNLPRLSGIDVLKWIREQANMQHGVLFLTCRTRESDVVRALQAGADDYVLKPFRAAELAARVNTLLRRSTRDAARLELIRAGEYVLDRREQWLRLRGANIELTDKEFRLVESLFCNIGAILSRDRLALIAWGRALNVESRSLDTHIYRIRQKLRLTPENGLRLASVYTLGYRLDQLGPPAADELGPR